LTYRETLQAVDTLKALKIVGIDGGRQGVVAEFEKDIIRERVRAGLVL
jgi:DNA invertase Pin-like site-specific DNA recombinase